MQQLFNHTSQPSAIELLRYPISCHNLGRMRYWVQNSSRLTKDRLFYQTRINHVWSEPKPRATADIIILLQIVDPENDNYGLIRPLCITLVDNSTAALVDIANKYVLTDNQKTKLTKFMSSTGYAEAIETIVWKQATTEPQTVITEEPCESVKLLLNSEPNNVPADNATMKFWD